MSGEDSLFEDGHSVFRPSYSATWLYCEDALISGLRQPDSGSYEAAVGTVFHAIMAEWQSQGRPDYRLGTFEHMRSNDGTEEWDIVVDEDMFSFGEECLSRMSAFKGERYIEHRVDISDITPIPNQGGTGDVIIPDWGILRVIDYKYGTGVKVFAHENSQGLLYLWGAFNEFDWIYNFQTIEFWIYQPRLHHYESYTITRQELIEWADWARERAAAAWAKSGRTRTPSPKACQWCRVNKDCAALEALREELVDLAFEPGEESTFDENTVLTIATPLPLPSVTALTTEQLAHIMRYRKLMERFFSQGHEELIRRIIDGEEAPGWRVTEGRTRTRWKDEEEVAEALFEAGFEEDQVYSKKLLSVAEIKKTYRLHGLRGKKLDETISSMRFNPPGAPTLIPDGDSRYSLPDYTEGFDDDLEDL